MKGLVQVITTSKRAARWRRTAQQLCEGLLRSSGSSGRASRVVDGYLITASKVGNLATGRVVPLDLLYLGAGPLSYLEFEGVPVETGGVGPYNVVYSWSDLDAFEQWAEDWQDWYDPTDPNNVDRGDPPLPLKVVGRFYADVLFGPDVGPVMMWTTTPLSSTDAVTTAAALTSWPRGPDQHFGNDIAWNPSANLFIDVQMFRPGGVTKFILEGGDTTGEVVVGEVPPAGPGPATLRYDAEFFHSHASGYNLTVRNRYHQIGGEVAWPVNLPSLDSTPDRQRAVTFIPVYQERWPGNSWPGPDPSSPFEYYGVHGLSIIQSTVFPEVDDSPLASRYEWTSDFISPYALPHPDLQRRDAEAVQNDPDWFGELRSGGQVDEDSRRRGSFCRLATRQGAHFEGNGVTPGGVALLVDVRHFSDSLAMVGLEPPGPPAPGGIPPEWHVEKRRTYTSGLLLVRVFDDGEVHTEAFDVYTNDPAAGKVYSVAAAHTLDGKAVFHVLRAVCTDQEAIDVFLSRQWAGEGTMLPPIVPFGKYSLEVYHVDGQRVDKYTVVDDVSAPSLDFIHLDHRWWEHLTQYNVTRDHGFEVGVGVPGRYWQYSGYNNPSVAIDQFRALVFMRSFLDVEAANTVYAGWTLTYLYDSRDHSYKYVSVLAESSFVSHVQSATLIQQAELDPDSGAELSPAALIVAGSIQADAGELGDGRMFVSRNSGRSWTLMANLPSAGGFSILGNAAGRVRPGRMFD